jgi:hypothetical protein
MRAVQWVLDMVWIPTKWIGVHVMHLWVHKLTTALNNEPRIEHDTVKAFSRDHITYHIFRKSEKVYAFLKVSCSLIFK